ncbi:MAG TPA: biotin carboxylase N-terminal domain-containing protein, partial [bacterium]|nr:biotin carboxylase N-terminal domain-containing protein [bacterium]
MFRRILVANRGEIAVRVIKAAHALGIEAVAVHSDVDRDAVHVKAADRAIEIGPAAPAESYLNVPRVLEAAKSAGCDALHPGYGFLSENAGFIRRCADAGVTFIGPSADAIERMADKVAAREAMGKAGLPLVPGSHFVNDVDGAMKEAERIGFPLMVKAAGGGGIGMSRVENADGLKTALETAKSRAEKAFADGRIYLERFVDAPHHIELQILGDGTDAIHVFDRECSVQRRFQKVVEEARAPFHHAPTDEMGTRAAAAAKSLGYVNAGTIECLVNGAPPPGKMSEWYFLEMNRRIQVEHPVTEMITGLDLVQAQIRIAADKKLPFAQSAVKANGHAIELRVCAEDPFKWFPAPGTITKWQEPAMEHVRVDAGVTSGSTISMFYDSLLAKLVVWGKTREEAIERAALAVDAFVIEGVKTNLPLHR